MICFIQVGVNWSHKSGVYWRQLANFKKLDFCAYSRGIGLIPALKNFREGFIKLFSTLPFDCPVFPKKYEAKLEVPLGEL